MAPSIIYSIGPLVEVDFTKTGYITEIDNKDVDNVLFKISLLLLDDRLYRPPPPPPPPLTI